MHAGWRAVAGCIRDALRGAGAAGGDVAAIAATSMREGMVLFDQAGREIWACPNVDSRASAEAADLIREGAAGRPQRAVMDGDQRRSARVNMPELEPQEGSVTCWPVSR